MTCKVVSVATVYTETTTKGHTRRLYFNNWVNLRVYFRIEEQGLLDKWNNDRPKARLVVGSHGRHVRIR